MLEINLRVALTGEAADAFKKWFDESGEVNFPVEKTLEEEFAKGVKAYTESFLQMFCQLHHTTTECCVTVEAARQGDPLSYPEPMTKEKAQIVASAFASPLIRKIGGSYYVVEKNNPDLFFCWDTKWRHHNDPTS